MRKHDYLSSNKLSRMGPLASFCTQSLVVGALTRRASSTLIPLGGLSERPAEFTLDFLFIPCFAAAM